MKSDSQEGTACLRRPLAWRLAMPRRPLPASINPTLIDAPFLKPLRGINRGRDLIPARQPPVARRRSLWATPQRRCPACRRLHSMLQQLPTPQPPPADTSSAAGVVTRLGEALPHPAGPRPTEAVSCPPLPNSARLSCRLPTAPVPLPPSSRRASAVSVGHSFRQLLPAIPLPKSLRNLS